MKKKIYIIDGSSFLYRAYYAIGSLTAPDGRPVQAVFGFCRMIKKVLDQFHPEYIAVVWDAPGKNIRHELYDGYKATRQKTPSDLADQRLLVQEFLTMIGMSQVVRNGVEADDVIASYAHALHDAGHETIIITSDKDLGQLVTDSIFIFDPFKQALLDQAAIEARYGFPLKKLCFYYSLVGDTSDAIPGVRGIGPKTAISIVQQFDSLDALYKCLEYSDEPVMGITPRIRQLLIMHKEMAYLSQELFTLRSVPVVVEDLLSEPFIVERYAEARLLFEQLGFISLLKSLPSPRAAAAQTTLFGAGPQATTIVSDQSFAATHGFIFKLITTESGLSDLCQQVKAAGICAIDTETDGAAVRDSALIGISICCRRGVSCYIPVAHVTGEGHLSFNAVKSLLGPLLADESIRKIYHNAKFDLLVLQAAGLVARGLYFDTMLAAGLLRGEGQKVGLKALSQELLGQPMHHFDEMVERQGFTSFAQVPLQQALDYAAADAHQTWQLYEYFVGRIEQDSLARLFYDVEMPLVPVLCEMETAGMPVDLAQLECIDALVVARLKELDVEISQYAQVLPGVFNPRSPQQVANLLFSKLGLAPSKKTSKSRAYSTDNESLEQLVGAHPVVPLIMRHRELSKIKGTYVDGLREARDPKTGRVYTSFRQATVATGRLSSADPNLQNIPSQAVDGISIRSLFTARPGYTFISADYSQIELRVLAHFSQDPVLLAAFARDEDVHATTAAGIFGISVAQVSPEQRQIAKRINFSILYGLTAFGLSKDLGVSLSEARLYLERYQATYPRVFAWMDEVIAKARVAGYVKTYLGRKRQIPELFEANKNLFQQGCRIAVNTVAQGTAAELVKLGMIAVYRALHKEAYDATMVLQVHDEIILEVAINQQALVCHRLTQVLESVVEWEVPLRVVVYQDTSWEGL